MSAGTQGLTFDKFGTEAGNAHFFKGFLESPGPQIVTPEFMKPKKMPKRKGDTAVFSRLRSIAPATTPITQGNYPRPVQFYMEQQSVQMRYYGSWTKMTRKTRDMSPYEIKDLATSRMREQWDETGERINWLTMNSGNHVIYSDVQGSGAAGSRDAINGPLKLKNFEQAIRQLRNSQAKAYMRKDRQASDKVGTQPALAGYAALTNLDVEYDLRRLNQQVDDLKLGDVMKFKVPAEYGGGSNEALNEYEIGQLDRVIFFGHTRLVPLRGAGAAFNPATSSTDQDVLTTGGKADVFMMPVFGQYAFCKVGLAGYRGFSNKKNGNNWKAAMKETGVGQPGNGQIMTTSLTPTKDDPIAWWFTAGWIDCYAAFIANDRWVRRIEFAVRVSATA